ncbi:hypothetical protein JTB14_004336 [Gonioctena quinquepunctata]|nr:hypothetical protein JTB14_004336 [Gonioctena quinquepunctata]
MEPQLDYKIIGLPNDLIGELKKFYVSLKDEKTTKEELLNPVESKVMKYVTKGMEKIKNVEDFNKYIGEDYNTIEYDSILGKIENPKLRVKIKNIEHLYRAIRLENVFRMYWDSIQADTYIPNINIDEYDIELAEADTILKRMDPKLWKKFSIMGKKYCDEHTRYKVDKSTKENLIDYCIENNDEDIAKKEEEEGALYQRLYRLDQEDLRKREEKWKKEELKYNLREKIKKEEKPPLLKHNDELNKMSAYNLDGIYDDSSMDKSRMEVGTSETTPDKKSTEKTGTSGKSKGKQKKPDMKEYLGRRAEIFKEAASKKGQKLEIEGKLKKERVAAKRTPSVAVEPPHVESDYEDEYFSHLSSIESEEESEQESEKFREAKKILEEISESKKTAQNLMKPTQAGPAGRSQEMPAKPNEGEKEVGNKNPETPKKGENKNGRRTSQAQSKRGVQLKIENLPLSF